MDAVINVGMVLAGLLLAWWIRSSLAKGQLPGRAPRPAPAYSSLPAGVHA
jgi:hypothetical protein